MEYRDFLKLAKDNKLPNELKMGFKENQRTPYIHFIVNDIYKKLKKKIKSKDLAFLDIGCGDGKITKLLIDKFKIKNYFVNDNFFFLNQIKWCNQNKKISGNFLKISKKIRKKFDLLLCYSVIHYIKKKNIKTFLSSLIKLLNKNGILFLGDIPDKKLILKFLKSKKGILYHKKYYNHKLDIDLVLKNKNIIEHQEIIDFLYKNKRIKFRFFAQDKKLHYTKFRKDLIILKK